MSVHSINGFTCRIVAVTTLVAAVVLNNGCHQQRMSQIPVATYLTSASSAGTRSVSDVHICPMGIRRNETGKLVLDFIVEGPTADAWETAHFLQVALRERPMDWLQIKDDSDRRLDLVPPKRKVRSRVQYRGVDGYELELPDNTSRFLVQYWVRPSGRTPKPAGQYYVQLMENTEFRHYVALVKRNLHLDTTMHEVEVQNLDVIPAG